MACAFYSLVNKMRKHKNMKTNYLPVCALSMVAGGLVLASGCVVTPDGRVGFAPVVVAGPAPVVVAPEPEPVLIPDDYVWDGYEYVGLVGDQYYYLGPGNVWLACDPVRLDRFHIWIGGHPDWRGHFVRNDRFRNDRSGHYHPRH
jgi:hypothetical protein